MPSRIQDDPAYRRLPSSPRFVLGHASYWLASDHLLMVDVIGTVERYRRFRLEDIELVTIRPTKLRGIIAGILAPLTALAGIGAGVGAYYGFRAGAEDAEAAAVLGIIAGCLALIGLIALIVAMAGGPMCRAQLSTGVQTIALPGLYRLRRANQFASVLQEAARSRTPAKSTPTPAPATDVPPPAAPP